MDLYTTYGVQVENRSWLWGTHGTEPGANPSISLDLSTFTAGTHYPNGYIPSGCVLGEITASGSYGPYDPAATDGRQVAAGLLFDSVVIDNGKIVSPNEALFVHGFVKPGKLPFESGAGALDEAAQTALSLIYFA